MSEPSDQQLVEETLAGNLDSFGRLVNRYQKTVFNVALHMIRDSDDAQDIAQNVFLKTFEKLKTFNPKYRFFSWIYKITVNESLNAVERKKKTTELPANLSSEFASPEEQFDRAEKTERIQVALMKLSVNHRAVIILKHLEELPYNEIGYILGIPDKKVKSRLFTARQKLKEILTAGGVATQ